MRQSLTKKGLAECEAEPHEKRLGRVRGGSPEKRTRKKVLTKHQSKFIMWVLQIPQADLITK